MWNPFDSKWFYDEGAEWMGKDKYFLPVPGSKDKKVSFKFGAIGGCVFVLAFFLLTIFMSMPDYTYKKLPNFDMLIGTMGWQATEVAPFIGVYPEDMSDVTDGTYKVPEGEVYAKMSFETTLDFKDNALCGFSYTYGAPVNAKKAAKDISNVAEMFGIDSMITSEKTRVEMNETLLRKCFEQFAENDQTFVVEDIENWTPAEHAYQNAVATYLRKLESDPDWEGRVGAYLVREAGFYRQIDMSYNPDTQWISVQIRFFTDIEPEQG